MTTTNQPTARFDYTPFAVWTGSKMIVWGGYPATSNDGGVYDPGSGPGTDSWTPTSLVGAPSARVGAAIVWTGTRMFVWSGCVCPLQFDGALYDPTGNTWTPISTVNGPAAVYGSAVWTGSKVITWGGNAGGTAVLNTGGYYDPATDVWSGTTLTNAPTNRVLHRAFWTGSRMLVWGGAAPSAPASPTLQSGGQYRLLSLYVKN